MEPLDSTERYQNNVFNAILFFTSEEGTKPIPNSHAEILLEVVVTVVEYLGGDFRKIPQPNKITFDDYGMTQRINEIVKQALDQNSKRLSPDTVKAISDLLEIRWEHGHDEYYHGESWWESNTSWWLTLLMSGQKNIGKAFILTEPTISDLREKIQNYFNPDTVEHCKQIGILMRKYIARDLANH